jgi:hypothetical protein
MAHQHSKILGILDACCEAFTFPMLDNGYVYLAASRLTLYRSELDWAMVIEIFGFSPRSGSPDVTVQTFASRLYNRDPREKYVSDEAYKGYLKDNAHNESRSYFPIEGDSWQDVEDDELVAAQTQRIDLRGQPVVIPTADQFQELGITLAMAPPVQVFELCRALAAKHRNLVLAAPAERRTSVLPILPQIMELNDWHHPDLAAGEKASDSTTFQQLAMVLETGESSQYQPSLPGNTHWGNWPTGGQL